MWIHKLPPRRESGHFHQRRSVYLKRQFQSKYTYYLLSSLFVALLVAGVPTYYFLQQNYKIFSLLALEKAPELLQTLELEQAWLVRIFTLTVLFSLLFYFYFGLKWTSRIVGPLLVLQNHVQRLSRGDFSSPQLKVRENDEFQDLVATYNYFYLLLRQKTISDLEKLRKIEPNIKDRVAHSQWAELVNERLMQLQRPTLLDESEKSGGDSRRVS